MAKVLDAGSTLVFMGMTEWMSTAPAWLVEAMESASKWAGISWKRTSGEADWSDDKRRPYSDLRGAEAWGSMVEVGRPEIDDFLGTTVPARESTHIIALDIDHEAMLIPSSTPGHYHLVIDHRLSWSDYCDLLETMAEVGLIQERYFDASRARGETFLRLPWIRKGLEESDARAALAEWLDEDERPKEFQSPDALEEFLASAT